MRYSTTRLVFGLAVLGVAVALLASGCAPRPPRGAPDFPAATVLSVRPGQDGNGSVLVESDAAGKASITIAADTRVLRETDSGYEQAAFVDVAAGQTLDVWTTGRVAESYPVQAWATAIVIRASR
ncbi:MAG: hypothetical protein QMD76_01355 [Anaerosomatales bacterium]|nr:hypothetical protein [Anaerosomatales bacterium]